MSVDSSGSAAPAASAPSAPAESAGPALSSPRWRPRLIAAGEEALLVGLLPGLGLLLALAFATLTRPPAPSTAEGPDPVARFLPLLEPSDEERERQQACEELRAWEARAPRCAHDLRTRGPRPPTPSGPCPPAEPPRLEARSRPDVNPNPYWYRVFAANCTEPLEAHRRDLCASVEVEQRRNRAVGLWTGAALLASVTSPSLGPQRDLALERVADDLRRRLRTCEEWAWSGGTGADLVITVEPRSAGGERSLALQERGPTDPELRDCVARIVRLAAVRTTLPLRVDLLWLPAEHPGGEE